MSSPKIFQIWTALVKRDDQNVYDQRPIVIWGFQGDKIVALKCTTNLNTNIAHLTLNKNHVGLKEDTVVELKRFYLIPKSKLLKYRGNLSFENKLDLIGKLDRNSPKEIIMQEKLILNESLFEEYGVAYPLDSNLKKQIDLDIKNAWGENYPGEGCVFIHPDGSFLNIYPKLDDHEDLCYWLEDEGYDSDYIVEDASWFTDTFNYIRCRNSIHLCFIALPDSKVTSAQLDSLERWMEEKVTSDYLDVVIENTDEQQHYNCEEYFPEDIIKKIKRYYSSGNLYESSCDSSKYKLEESLTEAKKKRKKKTSAMNSGEAIFKSVKDMQKWVKKRQKGMGYFVHMDCGNMEYNNNMFNKMHGMADASSDPIVDGGASDNASSGGDVGSVGMGESLETNKDKTKLSSKLVTFMKEHKHLINEKDWDTLFLDYAEDELSEEDQSQLVQALISIGCDIEVMD